MDRVKAPELKFYQSVEPELLRQLTGHECSVGVLICLGEGRIVSGSWDKAIRIWDVASGTCHKKLMHHKSYAMSLIHLGEGRFASGSSDGAIKIWDVASGTCEQTLQCHERGVTSLIYLGEGRIVTASWDQTIKIWDLSSGFCEKTLMGHEDAVVSLVELGEGRIASGSKDKTIKIWDVSSGTCEQTLIGHEREVSSLIYLGKGRIVSASWDKTIKIWDVSSGTCEQTLIGHEREVSSLIHLGKGRIVSASWDRTIKIWDVSSGFCEKTLMGGYGWGEVISLIHLGEGIVATGMNDYMIQIWDTGYRAEKKAENFPKIEGRKEQLRGRHPVVRKDAAIGHTGSRDIKEGLSQVTLPPLPDKRGFSRSPLVLNKLLVSSMASVDIKLGDKLEGSAFYHDNKGEKEIGGVKVSELKLGRSIEPEVLQTLTTHCWGWPLLYLGEGRIASGGLKKPAVWDPASARNGIKIWDVASGICEQTLTCHESAVCSLIHLDGGRIASGSYDNTIRIWDVASGSCQKTLTGHGDEVTSLLYLREGRIASGSDDKTIKIWNVVNEICEKTLVGHEGGLSSLVELGEGRIASGSKDKTIKIWNVARGACEQTLIGHERGVSSLIHLGAGMIASAGDDKTIKIWNVASRACKKTLAGHEREVLSLIELGEGRLGSGSDDGTIKIWNVASGICEQTLMGHQLGVCSLIHLGEGRIASGGDDETIKIWDAGYRAEKITEEFPKMERVIREQLSAFHPAVCEDAAIGHTGPQDVKDGLSQVTLSSVSDRSGSSDILPALSKALTPSIASTDIKVCDVLGEGGFGVVYQGSWQRVKVAIKQLRATRLTEKTLTSFREEVSLHGALRHPNVVTLYGACLEAGRYSMVMELMSGGSLYGLLHSTKELLWSARKNIAENIAVGLSYLHAHNIIHRDLKSLNVLLDENFRAKLADFGLSKVKSETQSTRTVAMVAPGTTRWKAPELFKRGAQCNQSSDIYAMGYVFWELSSRKIPFQDYDSADDITVSMWVKDGDRDDIPGDCPAKYAAIIRKCWAQEPTDRPKGAELVAEELEALEIELNLNSGYAHFSKELG